MLRVSGFVHDQPVIRAAIPAWSVDDGLTLDEESPIHELIDHSLHLPLRLRDRGHELGRRSETVLPINRERVVEDMCADA